MTGTRIRSLIAALASACRQDARPSILRIEASVRPERVSASTQAAHVDITISATNPRWWPVRIHLGGPPYRMTADPKQTQGIGFGYRISGGPSGYGPAGQTWGQPIYDFRPRQTQHNTFRLWINDERPGMDLPPGRYQVIGSFGPHVGAHPVEFEVTP